MPLEGNHAGDFAFEAPEGPVCVYDSKDGVIKSIEEVFGGGVNFFSQTTTGGDRALAERLTRRNMKTLPYWQEHPGPVLDGPTATDEEHADAMAKL